MCYDPFEVLGKVGDNSIKLNLPPYVHIYSIMNVENIKLFEPFMLDQEREKVLPLVEDF